MTPHKKDGKHHLILEILYKIKLHITIVLDMFNVCCLFHNLILGRRKVDVEELMQVILKLYKKMH
jgi:hypothetical protein